ncbi:unnamed protein product [Phytomonas sp. Hart1]|nr:unnamed protein product [Phytomonas sp. Hart1]|eukprot:CCW72005.1 unnamed protein product [Phytomonas sp. isolate Hart1]
MSYLAHAERFFDIETKRHNVAIRAAHQLDIQIRDMIHSPPLAQLHLNHGGRFGAISSSAAKAVTFNTDKSIILDLDGNESSDLPAPDSTSQPAGLTGSSQSTSSVPRECVSSPRFKAGGLWGSNLDEDIGGPSVAFSLNNNSISGIASKRHRVELASA